MTKHRKAGKATILHLTERLLRFNSTVGSLKQRHDTRTSDWHKQTSGKKTALQATIGEESHA